MFDSPSEDVSLMLLGSKQVTQVRLKKKCLFPLFCWIFNYVISFLMLVCVNDGNKGLISHYLMTGHHFSFLRTFMGGYTSSCSSYCFLFCPKAFCFPCFLRLVFEIFHNSSCLLAHKLLFSSLSNITAFHPTLVQKLTNTVSSVLVLQAHRLAVKVLWWITKYKLQKVKYLVI